MTPVVYTYMGESVKNLIRGQEHKRDKFIQENFGKDTLSFLDAEARGFIYFSLVVKDYKYSLSEDGLLTIKTLSDKELTTFNLSGIGETHD